MKGKLLDIVLGLIAIGFMVAAFMVSHNTTETVEKVLIGFAYTIIFFILVEHIPNRIKQQKYGQLIRRELKSVLRIIDTLLTNLDLNEKNLISRVDQLLQKSPETITAEIPTDSPTKKRSLTYTYGSVGEYLEANEKHLKQIKRRLEKFTFFVESDLLDIIISIEDFHLSSLTVSLSKKVKKSNPHQMVPEFETILKLQKQVRAYLKESSK